MRTSLINPKLLSIVGAPFVCCAIFVYSWCLQGLANMHLVFLYNSLFWIKCIDLWNFSLSLQVKNKCLSQISFIKSISIIILLGAKKWSWQWSGLFNYAQLRVMILEIFSNTNPSRLENDPSKMCIVKSPINPGNFLLICDNWSHEIFIMVDIAKLHVSRFFGNIW